MVWSIFEDRDENLYVGTDQGLTFFDNINGKVIHLKPDFSHENNLKNIGIYFEVWGNAEIRSTRAALAARNNILHNNNINITTII